jgi:hypothetical protein
MKTLFLGVAFLFAFGVNAQVVEKEVDLSLKYYDVFKALQSHKDLSFLKIPEKVFSTTQDGNFKSLHYNLDNYDVYLYSDNSVYIVKGSKKYYLTIVNGSVFGYSVFKDADTTWFEYLDAKRVFSRDNIKSK